MAHLKVLGMGTQNAKFAVSGSVAPERQSYMPLSMVRRFHDAAPFEQAGFYRKADASKVAADKVIRGGLRTTAQIMLIKKMYPVDVARAFASGRIAEPPARKAAIEHVVNSKGYSCAAFWMARVLLRDKRPNEQELKPLLRRIRVRDERRALLDEVPPQLRDYLFVAFERSQKKSKHLQASLI